MDPGVVVPLAVFAMVVLIVGMGVFAKVRDREIQTQRFLMDAEAEHRRRMAELDQQLQRLRAGV